jgi:hypothetical protein
MAMVTAFLAHLGCESKYQEKSPDAVQISMSPAEALQKRAAMNEKLVGFNKLIKRIDRISNMLNSVVSPFSKSSYSSIQFIKDLYTEFEGAPAEQRGNVYRKRAKFQVAQRYATLFIDGCSNFSAVLENTTTQDDQGQIKETTSLKVSNCNGAASQMVEVLYAEEVNRQTVFLLRQSAIQSLMRKSAVFVDGDASCKFDRTDKKTLYDCENLNYNPADVQRLQLARVKFNSEGSLKVIASIKISTEDLGKINVTFDTLSSDIPVVRIAPEDVLAGDEYDYTVRGDTVIQIEGVDKEVRDNVENIADSLEKIRLRIKAQKNAKR